MVLRLEFTFSLQRNWKKLESIGIDWNPLENVGIDWNPLEKLGKVGNKLESFRAIVYASKRRERNQGSQEWSLFSSPEALFTHTDIPQMACLFFYAKKGGHHETARQGRTGKT